VDGQFDPDDRCLRYYDAGSEEMEESEESEGMPMAPRAKEME
jgi:hypothetical protein